MTRTLALTLCLLLPAPLTTACGGDAPAPKPVEMPLPAIDPIPHAERVRYALERLERGPAPLGGLRVPDIHRRNLELAEDDLHALEREAQEALAEPERIARITGMARRNADPWHNVLRVLLGMKKRPAELVRAWVEPVLEAPPELVTLRLEAARVLSTIDDPSVAPTLLELFRRDPTGRELAPAAFSALLRQRGPARAEAMEIALRHGTPTLWADAWMRIARLVPPGEIDRELSDALSWWCGLIAGSGPRLPTKLPHLKSHPWTQARLATDPAVPSRADGARTGTVYGPVSSSISHGSGWYATDLSGDFVFPQYAYVYTGKLPAAEGRCVLGQWGYAPYAAAVNADLLVRDQDEGLYLAAKHCMLGQVTASDEDAQAALAAELDVATPWDRDRVRRVQQLMASLSSCDDPQAWALLARVLFSMRPLDVCRPAIEQAYDAMMPRPQDLHALVEEQLTGGDEVGRGIALHLVRRSRDPAYIEALEALLDAGVDPRRTGALRRTLTFIYSRGYGIEPDRYALFVKRYERWLASSDDKEFAALATGMLDFAEAGEAAFVRGLQGPRRAQFLAAWPKDRRIVSPAVAAAALAPMDADTPAPVVAGMLARAYYSFPPESAAVIEALKRRLMPTLRPLVAPVMERVMHRAPFRRQVK